MPGAPATVIAIATLTDEAPSETMMIMYIRIAGKP